ncbi:hypothetical protein, partial [Paraburkholderia elongata]|uniref:hypothetical protein n=1 Tax=Paraburkholderia elongata TaxID=2675747 RepID=UPI001C12FA4B
KPRQAQSPRREAKDVEFPDPATMGAAESANSAQSGYQVNSIGISPIIVDAHIRRPSYALRLYCNKWAAFALRCAAG